MPQLSRQQAVNAERKLPESVILTQQNGCTHHPQSNFPLAWASCWEDKGWQRGGPGGSSFQGIISLPCSTTPPSMLPLPGPLAHLPFLALWMSDQTEEGDCVVKLPELKETQG